jgi:hypothetical protein
MLHKSFKVKGSFLVSNEQDHEDDLLSFNIAQTYIICTALYLQSGVFKHTSNLTYKKGLQFTLITPLLLLYTLATYSLQVLLTKVLNKEGLS